MKPWLLHLAEAAPLDPENVLCRRCGRQLFDWSPATHAWERGQFVTNERPAMEDFVLPCHLVREHWDRRVLHVWLEHWRDLRTAYVADQPDVPATELPWDEADILAAMGAWMAGRFPPGDAVEGVRA